MSTVKKSLNILYISHEQSFGGATRSLIGLMDQMILRGHHVHVLMHEWNGKFADCIKERKIHVIPTLSYPCVYSPQNHFGYAKALLLKQVNLFFLIRNLSLIRDLQIDIIHSNTSYLDLGGYLKKYLRIPHIWHFREFLEEDFQLLFLDRNRSFKFYNTYSDALVFVSKSLFSKYLPFFDHTKMHLVYNGLNERYLQSKARSNTDCLKLLISSSFFVGKGQLDAIQAVKHLKDANIHNVFLMIAGKAMNAYDKVLRDYVINNHLTPQVKFLGWCENMNPYRKEADIELVCSKCEGFGRITIEAMMSMNPVIGANAGATPELVKDGYNGLLYEQGNSFDLARKIRYFLDNPSEVERMGNNAFDWSKNFTDTKNAEQIENIYYSLIDHFKTTSKRS